MKTMDFGYQIKAAQKVLADAKSGKYVASVLAACPGAGKTTISHHIINMIVASNPNVKILVLTEGQTTLQDQYLNELKSPNTPINFTYGEFDSNAQVRVGIPQNIKNLDWESVDVLIVDEAHNFFLAPMVQDIVKKFKPSMKILMTGSPTKYNLHNQNNFSKYAIYYISAEELQDRGVFSAVDMDVVRTVDKKLAQSAIAACIKTAYKNNDDLTKIMVACPTIAYANRVGGYLTSIGRKVAISTSKNDQDNALIDAFKAGEYDVLVVVGKGILGFNDKEMTVLFDMRSTDNIDASYQLFARVLRTHPQDVKKAYYRLADKDYNKQVLTLHKMHALMRRDIFTNFNGKNLKVEVQYA